MMIPLHRDEWYRFRFTEPRLVPRFHLDGLGEGTAITIHHLDASGAIGELWQRAIVGTDGWVEVPMPLHVSASAGFAVRMCNDDFDLEC